MLFQWLYCRMIAPNKNEHHCVLRILWRCSFWLLILIINFVFFFSSIFGSMCHDVQVQPGGGTASLVFYSECNFHITCSFLMSVTLQEWRRTSHHKTFLSWWLAIIFLEIVPSRALRNRECTSFYLISFLLEMRPWWALDSDLKTRESMTVLSGIALSLSSRHLVSN